MPVKVKLSTTITQEGQQEHFDFVEDGTFVEINGKYYLRYLEHQNGQETPVQVKFEDELVRLRRRGSVETNLFLDPHQATIMRYRTQYGILNLDVVTESLEKKVDVQKPAGQVSVKYQLKQAGQIIGSYQLELQFA
ncbi:DUF1934 domain-containing protein [Lactobacillus sp. 0.1XD8-4]|uniref:DUF1934 domain-containing protein n=1 Tax=Limosilactobacillus walteri TaxID=2268022 RepID=A0ABR8P4S8_9LACO|nr:DUF1934 domain-containing protein [uncultured Limosilactobacillus sp.]MBD5805621.1 DUF1934 domain-containing protein [Limosilactobacillus walteri]MRN05872.1 DUF1934 domain-containing protein [Lactobacillus sp. 0.1XD8-4]